MLLWVFIHFCLSCGIMFWMFLFKSNSEVFLMVVCQKQ